jgi:(p)ppGpp synthase/HD superfamily hydrolase
MKKIDEAIALAVEAHKNQKLDEDGMPHMVHCMEVMLRVKKVCDDHTHAVQVYYPAERALAKYTLEELLIAAILHDSVEDSEGKVTLEMIREKFGDNVATLVDGVTRRGLGKGETKEFYRDFIYRAREDDGCALIKSCDLEHNYSRAFKIKSASWRDKLEFKYRVALRVLSSDRPTWEQASWTWQGDPERETYPHPKNGHFFIADPNGKRIEISEEDFHKLQVAKFDQLQ